jgi:hypothetical protein
MAQRTTLWHPYQGLWNWQLVGTVRRVLHGSLAAKIVVRLIVMADTLLLAARAVARRVARLGPRGLLGTRSAPSGVAILYFDLGTHTGARELSFMVHQLLPRVTGSFRAFGFEACRAFWEQARVLFTGRADVEVVHAALCHFNMPASGTIKLYTGQGEGLNTSIYREGLAEYEEAPAARFSDWLRASGLDVTRNICLLRMNIEGAEYDVIHDLVENQLAGVIDGYYGMWDDISKVDAQRSNAFRALLKAHGIAPFTFNGRDLRIPARMRCIEYDIRTSIGVGLRRIGL